MYLKNKCFFLFVSLLIPNGIYAAPTCSKWLAKIISVQGTVDAQPSGKSVWQTVDQNKIFCSGDKIRISKHSRATIQMSNQSRITLNQGSTMVFLPKKQKSSPWLLKILKGSAFFRSRQPQHLNIETPFINAVHEGTEFLVTVNTQQTEITVFDGQVAATNKLGKIHIKKGFTGIATKNDPPKIKPLTVRPEDAVQWTLYYPPIINSQYKGPTRLYNNPPQDNLNNALTLLEKNQDLQHNATYLSNIASLLLSVGSIDEALVFINKIQILEPNNSDAMALQAIIAVTKNQQDKALTLAQKAIKLDSQSATAQIALSYAYQSKFKIDSALQATQKATRLSPDNALALARLSELQLSTGERSDALESAKKAQQLNPKLDRTQTILGFAYLSQVDIDDANVAFGKAIDLNSADPLARLGLGLAKIRRGDIEEGTRDLETAVSLDPDNAIMRSYLGKAHYELKNDDYAGTELTIAKEMDAKDPTPWFYDAIRKQTTNRPVEALHDMQKAIELNDNRGVYRSKLLLDEDLAARSASLGRIYNDLGFQQLGLIEGWKSVASDPSNHSAHRLLADNYASLPRHEIARVSELLQSQLLQPMNMTPVQPQLAESTSLTVNGNGPSSLSFNEFNPVYTRDQFSLQASGVFGSNNTWGDEVIQSGLWENFSYSLGQFHYETDGFRDNHNIEHDLYNIFAQYRVTPEFSIQTEYRRSEIDRGDIDINFNEIFSVNDRFKLNQDTVRIGSHYSPSKNSDIIMSLIYNKQKANKTNFTDVFIRRLNSNHDQKSFSNNEEDGYQAELQYLFHSSKAKLIVGGGGAFINGEQNTLLNILTDPCPLPRCQRLLSPKDIKTRHYNGYLYSDIFFPKDITWTVGFSLDSYEDKPADFTRLNPKFGLKWQVMDSVLLRLAAFKTLKRVLLVDQTIEPTQISGFNQFFDDFNGSNAVRYGAGLDFKFTEDFKGGLEVSIRDIKKLIKSDGRLGSEINFDNEEEELYKSYLYWTPTPSVALSLEPQYEIYKNERTKTSGAINNLKTFRFPLSIRYFNEIGLFSEVNLTYLQQNITYKSNFLNENGEEKVFLLDFGIGYRFPKRIGVINVEVNNILNEKYQFQDNNFRLTPKRKRTSHFIPDRTVFVKTTINF